MKRTKFKCVHCNSDMPIPIQVLGDALNNGKSVMECESCNKLNTVRSDDEESVYIAE